VKQQDTKMSATLVRKYCTWILNGQYNEIIVMTVLAHRGGLGSHAKTE